MIRESEIGCDKRTRMGMYCNHELIKTVVRERTNGCDERKPMLGDVCNAGVMNQEWSCGEGRECTQVVVVVVVYEGKPMPAK